MTKDFICTNCGDELPLLSARFFASRYEGVRWCERCRISYKDERPKEMDWKELTYCKTFCAGQYYSKDIVIPDGYEVVDYRPARAGEQCLGFKTGSILFSSGPGSIPMLILQRKKTRKIVLTEVRRGHVEEGEYYVYEVWGKTTIAGPYRPCVAPPTHRADIIAYRREDVEE